MATEIQKCQACKTRPVTERDRLVLSHPREDEFHALIAEIELAQGENLARAGVQVATVLCDTCFPDGMIRKAYAEAIEEALDKPTSIPLLVDWVDDIDLDRVFQGVQS